MIVPDMLRITEALGSLGFFANNDGLVYDANGPFPEDALSPAWRAGIRVGDRDVRPGRAIVRNSTILAPGAGVDVIGDSTASIGHNVIANHFGDSEHSDAAVMVRGGSATITSNDVSGYFFGVLIPAGQAAVLSNTIHDNLTGVEVGNFSGAGGAGTATVVNNDIHHNALFGGGRGGVEVSSDGSIVSANRVHDNAGHGISVTPTASGNQILANVATNNDCSDSSTGNATAGTANTWLNNIGPSSFPPGICLPPGP